MYVIEVIPLKRGVEVSQLSYFSSQTYKLGVIVSVPFRKKTVLAIVIKSESVKNAKTTIKTASFSLRKLMPESEVGILPPALIKTATNLLRYYPTKLGTILFALLPTEIKNGKINLPDLSNRQSDPKEIIPRAPKLIVGKQSDRYIEYRSLVRETFAGGGSVLFVVPTVAGLEFAKSALELGIEERVICFSRTDSIAKKRLAYNALADLKQTKLIITTPTHAYLDRPDIINMIIEEAGSSYYTMRRHPLINHLDSFITLAKYDDRQIILGDLVPRTEEEVKRRSDDFYTLGEYPKRLTLPAKLSLLKPKSEPGQIEPFHLFSNQLIKVLSDTLKNRGRVYMYAARRGLAPVITCRDCGYVFRCPDSGTPYSLFRTGQGNAEKRWFISGVSGRRVKAAKACGQCGSWRLREKGIGVQYVYDALLKIFPPEKIILFDHTTANTHKQRVVLSDRFYQAKNGIILLGTKMSIAYLTKPITISVVTSLDALSANTTWRNSEEVFKLLLILREKSQTEVLVQTRQETDNIFTLAEQGALEAFYNDEIDLRQALNYPPFVTFVHLTWQGNKIMVDKLKAIIINKLKGYSPTFYPSPHSYGAKLIRHGLLRQQTEKWPDEDLLLKLKSLPPAVKITINPDRIV